MFKNFVALLIYSGFTLFSGISIAQVNCTKNFTTAEDDVLFPDVEVKIKYLESLEAECKKLPEYAVRLSELFISVKLYKEAEGILKQALRTSSGNEKGKLQFSLADMYFISGQLDKAKFEAEKIIASYPSWYAGYFVLGSTYLLENKSTKAIFNLEKAAVLSNDAEAYGSLAIAYHKDGRNVETIKAMDKAISLDKKSYANRLAVPATVYAYAKLNRLEDAKKLLIIHQHYRPESQNDPEFSRVAMFVEKMLKGTK